MKIKILVFGVFTDIFKTNKVYLELPEPLNVGQLRAFIIKNYSQTAALNFAIAVDEAYAEEEQIINTNQAIALIPPVSGG